MNLPMMKMDAMRNARKRRSALDGNIIGKIINFDNRIPEPAYQSAGPMIS